ncbi:MAG TPA: hypothetical protein VF797_16390 [Noviherbaspirillum sp.]
MGAPRAQCAHDLEYDTTERFPHARRIVGPWASADTDYTSRIDLAYLPRRESIFVRDACTDP